ncbi:MAG: hypothetical protein NC078_12700 [Ruminococcus sp.]|nr:hypothetical protein [Ruminococcus sp.]
MITNRILPSAAIAVNIIGDVFLVYYAAVYLIHDTAVQSPDSMLPIQNWDRAGLALAFGFLPLLAVNFAAFFFIKVKPEKRSRRFLFFIPSGLCLIFTISYFITSLRNY